nr:hypothetical protein [Actinoplanes maris]
MRLSIFDVRQVVATDTVSHRLVSEIVEGAPKLIEEEADRSDSLLPVHDVELGQWT